MDDTPIAMPQTVAELSLVSVAVRVLLFAMTVAPVTLPSSLVFFSILVRTPPEAFPLVPDETTVVAVAVRIGHTCITMKLAILKLSLRSVPAGVLRSATPATLALLPFTFILQPRRQD